MDGEWGHFNDEKRAKMIDVSHKPETLRTAVAVGRVTMNEETMKRVKAYEIKKGDVLAVAQVAGVMAAKKTPEWIPMCHSLQLTGVNLSFTFESQKVLSIRATVKTKGSTGVEMEALTAVQAAALTVYDMCKGIDKDMVVGPSYLESKTGGKSGDYHRK